MLWHGSLVSSHTPVGARSTLAVSQYRLLLIVQLRTFIGTALVNQREWIAERGEAERGFYDGNEDRAAGLTTPIRTA